MTRRYLPEQLARIFRESQAHSWQDVLDYLGSHGDRTPGLGHDQVAEMEDDLEKMMDREESFTGDAEEAYRIIDSIQPEQTTIGPGSPSPDAKARR